MADDVNATTDVFAFDLNAASIELVSVGLTGPSDSWSGRPDVSANGRHVSFVSSASNLVAGTAHTGEDAFVRDRRNASTVQVSVSPTGQAGEWCSFHAAISLDGSFVAFDANPYGTDALVDGDTNQVMDIFVRRQPVLRTTLRASVTSAGAQSQGGGSYVPTLSGEGRYLAFASYASNLVAGDTNGRQDVFVRDNSTGAVERVSVATAGAQGDDDSGNISVSVSADGRYVAFESYASTLVVGDTNDDSDVFVHDRQTHQTVRVSVGPGGVQGNANSATATISSDGRYVTLESYANNLSALDWNGYHGDVFQHDRVSEQTSIVSRWASTTAVYGVVAYSPASTTPDGRYVVFSGAGPGLIPYAAGADAGPRSSGPQVVITTSIHGLVEPSLQRACHPGSSRGG